MRLFFGADFILSEFTDISFEVKAVLCLDFYAFGDVFRRNGIVQQICIVNNHFELERTIPIYVRKDSMSECVWISRKASPKRGLSIGKSEFIRTFRFMFFYMEIGNDFVLTAGYFLCIIVS